jgi:hypothetical protein
MTEKFLKDEYETPLAMVRGVFLCDNVADTVHSPVRRIELEEWDEVTPDASSTGNVTLPVFY